MIKADIKFKYKLPDLDLQEEFAFIAERIFIPILAGNIQNGRNLNEGPFPPLEQSTIKRKGHARPLVETGKLHRAFIWFKRGTKEVVLTLNPDRKEIGSFLQIEGIRSKAGRKFFNFFGISQRMENEAVLYVREQVKEKIKNA